MVARAHIPAARRRGPTARVGLRLVVFHASRDVQAHVAPLKRSRRFKVSCYPQRSTEGGSRSATVDAVLWELAPGRRPNWRRLKAMAVATRVRDRVRQHVFLKEAGINYRLTASVGVATMPDAATTVDGLLQAADDAMYTVKAHGKDGVFLAGAPAEAGVLSREDRSA